MFYRNNSDVLPVPAKIVPQNNHRLLVLIICVLSILVWRCCFLYQKAQIPYLQISVHSSLVGSLQLYYDQGFGFNEHDSAVKGPTKYSQMLWGMVPWLIYGIGQHGPHYYFQLPEASIYALKLQALKSHERFSVNDATIVNGLGDFILGVAFDEVHYSEKVGSSIPHDGEPEKVAGQRPTPLMANAVFDPPVMLGEFQSFCLENFFLRVLAELLVLLVLTALFVGFERYCLSLPSIRKIYFLVILDRSIQDQLLFIFFTIIFLWFYRPLNEQWFPMLFEKALLVMLVILTVRSFLNGDWRKEHSLVVYVVFLVLLLYLISAGMHYFAGNSLVNENYLSYYKFGFQATLLDNYAGVKRLAGEGENYIYMLPFVLIVATSLFSQASNKLKMLRWVTYLYLPCLLVALYQVYVDSTFLNNRPSDDLVGGLAISFISFRILLFLLLPLYVFSLLIAQSWWRKVLLSVPIIAILWLAKLSMGRAAILGIMIFFLLLPAIKIWVDGPLHKLRNYRIAGATLLMALTIIAGILSPKFHFITSKILSDHFVVSTYALLQGQKDVDPRQEMQAQAFKLIKEAPLGGWGPAGFVKNVDRVRFVGGHASGVTQSMTSLYLGILLKFGVSGLACIVFLCLMPLFMVFRVRNQLQDSEEKLAVGIISSVVCIMFLLFNFNPNIDYQDVLWVFMVYQGFLISVAMKYDLQISVMKYRFVVFITILSTLLLAIGTYRTSYGSLGYRAIQNDLVSFILQGYQTLEQQTLIDSTKLQKSEQFANKLIATRGNPFRMKYTTNVFHIVASSTPIHVNAASDLVCINTSVKQQGNRISFILGLRVFLGDKLIDEHLFYNSGIKKQFYEIQDKNKEIRVEVDMRQSIPYHEDERTELTQSRYNPLHIDYRDLGVTVSAITYAKAQLQPFPL